MAKGIDILGTLRGKRGGVVYYRANGAQLSRPRVSPKNPRSAKQAVQRMVLASASKLAAAYKPIVNHSQESMQVGQGQVNLFRSRTMKLLRQAAAVYVDGSSVRQNFFADYPLKGSPSTGFVSGLEIARGSLPMNYYIIGPDDEVYLALSEGADFSLLTSAINTEDQYRRTLAAIGLEPGDQLTVVFHASDVSHPVASFVYGQDSVETDFLDSVRFARIVFSPTFDAEGEALLVGTSQGSTTYHFNDDFIVEREGQFPLVESASYQGANYLSIPSGLGSFFLAGGLIRSKKVNGKFKYSTSMMLCNEQALDHNNAYPTYLSYMDGASVVNVGPELYLQNAVEAAPL